ncbi:MAG: hypothetical protein M0R66_07085 [Candidatus Omnitrophica bacterium]|nr:hypothetical protein [Candidatus Omnitrophota bacterium]
MSGDLNTSTIARGILRARHNSRAKNNVTRKRAGARIHALTRSRTHYFHFYRAHLRLPYDAFAVDPSRANINGARCAHKIDRAANKPRVLILRFIISRAHSGHRFARAPRAYARAIRAADCAAAARKDINYLRNEFPGTRHSRGRLNRYRKNGRRRESRSRDVLADDLIRARIRGYTADSRERRAAEIYRSCRAEYIRRAEAIRREISNGRASYRDPDAIWRRAIKPAAGAAICEANSCICGVAIERDDARHHRAVECEAITHE